MKLKTCSICEIVQSEGNFYLKSDGTRRSDCRACVRSRHKKYEQNNRTSINLRRKKLYYNNREKALCLRYERSDKRKHLNFDLTPEWIKEHITGKPCTYCNSLKLVGCDRKDNKFGHTKLNCIPCCHDCNIIRGNRFTVDQMVKIGKFLQTDIYNANSNKIEIKTS